MTFELSEGAIRDIRISGENSINEPVLQCLSVKKVASAGGGAGGDRYRAILSDGITFLQAMFATQLNPMADDGTVGRFTVIKVLEYTVNLVKDKTIMIIHRVEPVGQADAKIGEPASVDVYIQAENDHQIGAGAAGANPGNGNPYNNNNGGAAVNPYNQGGGNNNNRRPGGPGGAAGGPSNRAANMSANPGQQHPIYPIEGLSPYQNKWTIKARVTNKSDIRHWSNAKGEGKLFSVTLMDETGEIKATGFNDTVDQFYNLLEEGKVYFISKARIGIAKKQFSNVNNEYEISFENGTEISLCTDTENVPQVKYNFVELNQLESVDPNSIVDVIAVVKETGEVSQITSKATQKPLTKRELTLVDTSGMSIRLTLWGRQAENFSAGSGYNDDGTAQPVIAFKSVRVGDFGGRSLSMVSSSSMTVDPDIQEAHSLRGWYDNQGAGAQFQAYTSMGGGAAAGGGAMRLDQFKVVSEVKDAMLGTGDQPDNFWIRGTLVYVKKDNMAYPACPTPKCAKKVMLEENNSWRCEKCERSFPNPEYRYILQGQIADWTGFLYISCFNEVGQVLIGHSADEMEALKTNDEAEHTRIIDQAVGSEWNFSIRAKSDQWQDQQKIRYTIMRAVPAQYAGEEGHRLMDMIKAYGDIQI